MKTLISFLSGGVAMAVWIWFSGYAPSDECSKIVASYDKTQDLYEQRIAQQDDIIQYTLASVAIEADEVRKLRLARIPLQAKANTIEALAAKIAPIERVVKQEAQENKSWAQIPPNWKDRLLATATRLAAGRW